MTEGFGRYAELARRLDDVRSREVARNAGELQGAADQTAHADALEARLNGQRGMLQRLAGELGFRPPRFTPVTPSGPVDPARALAEIADRIDFGDAMAEQAAQRSEAPTLMPRSRPRVRAATIYGAAAVLIFALQAPGWHRLVTDKQGPNAVMTLFVVPAVVFGIAWLVLRFGVRTRLTSARSTSSTRLGLLLCFGVGPVGVLLFVAWGWRSGA